jgi:hypothetical protein
MESEDPIPGGSGSDGHLAAPGLELREKGSLVKKGPRRIKRGIADADKTARTGVSEEAVRDTPPAGQWNDTSAD